MALSFGGVRKKLDEINNRVKAQVNPFDGGKTYANYNKPAPQPAPKPQGPSWVQRNVQKPIVDNAKGLASIPRSVYDSPVGQWSRTQHNASRYAVGKLTGNEQAAQNGYNAMRANLKAMGPALDKAANSYVESVKSGQIYAETARPLPGKAPVPTPKVAPVVDSLSRAKAAPPKPVASVKAPTKSVPKVSAKPDKVLNPDAPDFLQVKQSEITPPFKGRVTAKGELPISKPQAKSKAPAGTGTIPLEQLGKKPVVEGPTHTVTGKVPKDPVMADVLGELSKSINKSRVEGNLVAADIASKARELKVKPDRGFIDRYQAGKPANANEAKLGQHIKNVTDQMFLKEQSIDPGVVYKSNYVRQDYAQPTNVVAEASNKLRQATGAEKRSKFKSFAEAESVGGLTPKYETIDQMLGTQASRIEQARHNQALVDRGLEGGVFTTETNGTPVTGLMSRGGKQIYAEKRVADTLNGITQRDSTGAGRVFDKTAKASELAQDVMLQGGVKQANFFVAGQMVKDTTRNIGKAPLHPVEALKQEGHMIGDFFRTKNGTQKRFSQGEFKAGDRVVKNADFVRELADNGLYIDHQTGMASRGSGKVDKLKQGWSTVGNNPTFGRYMPNRLLSTAQEVYSQSVGRGMSHSDAIKLAADTGKTYNGIVDTVAKGRGNLGNDIRSSTLFAPKYRESILNSLGNVVKSVYPKNWKDPKFAPSRQLLAGMGETLIAYELLNRKLTGHSMLENRQGQELSLEIPYGEPDETGKQKVLNVPFMPGFMTIPRAAVGAAMDIKDKNPKGVVGEVSKMASAPLQTIGRVVANEDYFGRPIYMDAEAAAKEGVEEDSAPEAAFNVAKYVFGQSTPSWIRGALDKASGKPTEQAIATAMEAPIRFGKRLPPQTEAYFNDREEIYNGLDKNSRAVWDAIHPAVKNVKGEYIVDKTVDSGLARASNYLNNPAVLQAENEMARRAKARGEQVDPLFGDLDPNQQRIALRMDTLPPKDPNKTILREQNPWYQEYTKKREKFFDSLPPGDPNKPKAPIAYPEPSAEVAALQDAYYQLTDSNMKRQVMKDNPELADQFAREEQYTRSIRAAKNLPQYDKYPEADKNTQNLIDFYSSLPKGESNGKSRIRSAWIKSHQAEWDKMSDYFSKVAQYNLQQDASLAAFEGRDLTEKGIKSIKSLAQNLGMSDSGYGGRFGSGGGGGSKSSNPLQYAVKQNAGGTSAVSSTIKKTAVKKPKVAGKVAAAKPKATIKKAKV